MVGSRVYVGRLPFGVRERDLEKFFKKFGKTRDILLKNGYGFVEFEDFRDADDACYELNGKDLLGERIIVEPARGIDRSTRRDRYGGGGGGGGGGGRGRDRFGGGGGGGRGYRNEYGPPTRTDHRLIVENLSSKVNWQDLKDYMRAAGEVSYADAHRERRNEGVVEFVSSSDMRAALEKLDGTELNGRRIRLVEDTSKRGPAGGRGVPRRRSRSASSRSRSRSPRARRSRSRSRRSSRSRSNQKSKSPAKKSRSRSASKDPSGSRQADANKSNGSRVAEESRDTRSRSHTGSRSRSRSAGSDRSRDRSPKRNDDGRNSGDD